MGSVYMYWGMLVKYLTTLFLQTKPFIVRGAFIQNKIYFWCDIVQANYPYNHMRVSQEPNRLDNR